jgi:threonine synthase
VRPLVAGFRCAVCGAASDVATPFTWRCPNAGDGGHHAPQIVQADGLVEPGDSENPFVAFRTALAWDAFAAAHGLTDAARWALVADLDARIAIVDGHGFRTTPFLRHDALSDRLGFTPDGGVWVKDETGNVAGSHKARHLMSIALHLVTAETLGMAPWASPTDRPPLAIASCGNAALAAATIAAALDWPISVFIPEVASFAVVARLGSLGADMIRCSRGAADPPGDPCVHRFRDAVTAGAVPFSVQGTENAWSLDGGRTIGWEIGAVDPHLDRIFVQVGGGALAACVAQGLRQAGSSPRLHAVQTAGSAPLERAWRLAGESGVRADPGPHWGRLMWPWEDVRPSAADGILDDEAYDWVPVIEAMAATDGSAEVVDEATVREARAIATVSTRIDVSATGSAGLAGLLALGDDVERDERVAVVFSGVRR